MPLTLPTTEELTKLRNTKTGEFIVLLHDGSCGVDMVAPENFYDLPLETIWTQYLMPAVKQMASIRASLRIHRNA